MIRVPRRPREADRLIPIQYDAKIEAVEKALSAAMQTEKVGMCDIIKPEALLYCSRDHCFVVQGDNSAQ